MSFTDNLVPTNDRYSAISDASSGNYAFIWDYLDRSISHRHHSIVGFDPTTGEYATPWMEAGLYDDWKKSEKPLREFLAGVPPFDNQSRDKKPAKATTQAGTVALECRYLNFAPQCHGWYDLTQHGGSGSFLILWTGVWKLTTAATIPYYTGHYSKTPRGFGFVTIGANIDYFHKPALETTGKMESSVSLFGERMKQQQVEIRDLLNRSMQKTAFGLTASTLLMVLIVVAIAVWLASLLTKRVTTTIEGLQKIEQGQLDFRFSNVSHDEMGKLTESLNRMADSVHESFKRLEEAKQEAEQASHMKSDFPPPECRMSYAPAKRRSGLCRNYPHGRANGRIREHAEIILQSGNQLLSLLNDILDLAKIEAGYMTLESADIALPTLLREVVAIHEGGTHQRGSRLNQTSQRISLQPSRVTPNDCSK